jgi:competence ComEA-like helix-hairpin-helix protein
MKQFLKILVTFSKNERIGIAVLLVLLVAFLAIPPLLAPFKAAPDFSAFLQKIDSLAQLAPADDGEIIEVRDVATRYKNNFSERTKRINLISFDPNTADTATLEQLGFSPKQAAVIINYRSKGAVFRTPDDFKKVFVVSPEHFEQLQPYIHIADIFRTKNNLKFDTIRFQKREPIIVELNTADTAELQKVIGIGAFTAVQIAKYREQLGGFARLEQLYEIRNMTTERFEQIAPQLTLDTSLVTLIDLQTADEYTLKKHPYISAYAARGIVHFRTTQGKCDIDALIKNNILETGKAEQLRPYCTKNN